jgi:organic hydroperoxide reductase OsmC/OhrA
MTGRTHTYTAAVEWLGNRGTGTSGYRDYDRTHVVRSGDKPPIAASSDPVFRGETDRWNPEELLVASLSQCHMLQYLHLAADHGIIVVAYMDDAAGTLVEEGQGGHFSEVVLRPTVAVRDASMIGLAQVLHHEAHQRCFIATSVRFPVRCEPTAVVAGAPASGHG